MFTILENLAIKKFDLINKKSYKDYDDINLRLNHDYEDIVFIGINDKFLFNGDLVDKVIMEFDYTEIDSIDSIVNGISVKVIIDERTENYYYI